MQCLNPFNPCILIPCYNHADSLPLILDYLQGLNLPCIIINDGSNQNTQQTLHILSKQYGFITLIEHEFNQGKGKAVATGFKCAIELGFSHALQIDSDGQHQISQIPEFLALSKAFPEVLISGRPIYDESVPKARLYGRYITHVWVWIETLSLSIVDSMCGFRVYPLKACQPLINSIRPRMDFDTDIMVRLYWAGTMSKFIPTKVTYPENGLSHFRVVADNWRITKMHTRLVMGMILRLPKLLFKKIP